MASMELETEEDFMIDVGFTIAEDKSLVDKARVKRTYGEDFTERLVSAWSDPFSHQSTENEKAALSNLWRLGLNAERVEKSDES
ncbi:hypothetical protein BGZ99_003742, partial [Dissophora globulifera]